MDQKVTRVTKENQVTQDATLKDRKVKPELMECKGDRARLVHLAHLDYKDQKETQDQWYVKLSVKETILVILFKLVY